MRKWILAAVLWFAPVETSGQVIGDGTADGPNERITMFPNAFFHHQTFVARAEYLTRMDIWYWGATSDGDPLRPNAGLRFTIYEGTADNVFAGSLNLFSTWLPHTTEGRYSIPFPAPIPVLSGAGYTMLIVSDDCGPINVASPNFTCPPVTGVYTLPTLAVSVFGGTDLYPDGAYRDNGITPALNRDMLFYAEYTVPEPASIALVVVGTIGVAVRRRRRY
jgi:hypothetical protein